MPQDGRAISVRALYTAAAPIPGDGRRVVGSFAMRTNWARNVVFGAKEVVRPASVDELPAAVVSAPSVRVVGSGHSFSDVADTDGVHIDVSGLDGEPELRTAPDGARTVLVAAGWTYWRLSVWLHERGLALSNLASLPHISVAGSIATGTHGSGIRNRSLAGQVRALELVDGTGALHRIAAGDPGFDGAVVSLGLLGVVVRVEVSVVPAFEVAQFVTLDVPFATVRDDPAALLALGYSTSVFTRWRGASTVDAVWVKTTGADPRLAHGTPATRDVHPVITEDAANSTVQRGVRGAWHERLPHFRPDHSPSTGAELQSELFVDVAHASDLLDALGAIAPVFAPALQVCEIRAIAADDLWLSGAYGRDTIGFHFTWGPDAARVRTALAAVEDAAAPFAPRPHWGKITTLAPAAIVGAVPRWADFAALRARLDPDGRFLNAYARRLLEATPAG